MKRVLRGILLAGGVAIACTYEDTVAPSAYHPLFWQGESSDDEELIGGAVSGASGQTVYSVSVLHPEAGEPVGTQMYFSGAQPKHRWGIFSSHANCPSGEQHYQSSSLDHAYGLGNAL